MHARSKRPHVSSRATRVGGVGKIIYLCQHYGFGPAKISVYLKRYHVAAAADERAEVARGGA
jgi:hypothetical protein